MTAVARSSAPIFLLLAAIATPALSQDRILTLHDVSSVLGDLIAGTPLDFVAKEEIKYGVTGKAQYDEFHRSSAIAYGGFVIGQGLTDDATMNLKKYARNKAAVAELQEEISALTAGADTSEWTIEQSLAVLQAAKAKDQLSDEERAYMVKTATHLAACMLVVKSSISASTELTGQAPGLIKGARSAFGLRKAGGATKNVKRSADRIKAIPTDGPKLVESLVVLSKGLSMVSGGA